MSSVGYRFNNSDSGIFVEIYLPKKAAFQGTLYQALTEGFDLEAVRAYLKERKEDIGEFFAGSPYFDDFDRRVGQLRQVFTGYSMYEVDGVFYGGPGQPIAEERTQVIRIMFRPQLSVETPAVSSELRKGVIREYVRFPSGKERFADHFLATNRYLGEEQVPQLTALIRDLRDWEAQVAIFLFGYIIFSICERIRGLGEEHDQDEIWVTSLWNLSVNTITKVEAGTGPVESSGDPGPKRRR